MRFIISASTVSALNSTAFNDFRELVEAVAPHLTATEIQDAFTTTDLTSMKYANHSMQLINGEWVFEINDEGAFKLLRMFGRVASVAVTFVAPIKALFKVLDIDMADFKRWVNLRK